MAWNEPSNDKASDKDEEKKPNDPWQQQPRQDGPPDLDEVWNDMKNKFGGLLGNKSGGNRGGNSSNGKGVGGKSLLLFLLIPLAFWGASGFYTVDEGKEGVVLQFGRYIKTSKPGLRYHLPSPIQNVQIVDTQGVRIKEIGYRGGSGNSARTVQEESLMLTEDENIVDVKLSVQYQVADPKLYLFAVNDPDQTLFQVVESTTRGVVGQSTMDYVLTEGRSSIVSEIQSQSQKILDELYHTGLLIGDVNLQDAQPPDEVQKAFDDAIKAREDEQRSKNEAEAYRNDLIPKARGQAAAILEQAEGYKQSVIAAAEGEAARFSSLLSEYQKAPEVTKQRLYLETMEQVMGNTKKVLMPEQGGNLTMLPLADMLNGQPTSSRTTDQKSITVAPVNNTTTSRSSANTAPDIMAPDSRSRER